ncbi:unnamed protein product [Rhizophagus irregularis]|nr:unnamed protein product [Rhizophagus irregularis]
MDETPKDLWKYDVKYQYHVTIPTIDSTIESENIKSHLQIYLNDIVQCFGITQDPNNKDSDTSYTAQSTSANPISECLDVQLSELELNEIYQDGEDNI